MKKGISYPYLWSLFFFYLIGCSASAQLNDTALQGLKADSVATNQTLSSVQSNNRMSMAYQLFDSLVIGSYMLSHDTTKSIHPLPIKKTYKKTDSYFYFLLILAVFLGLLKTIFSRYFNNMLRVFFNTSLRQSQLTEQLLQAPLPTWLFNIYFYLVAGSYVYSILIENKRTQLEDYSLLILLVATFMMVYVIKSVTLFLFGWIAGYQRDAQLYNFIVTLTNQLLSILLLPMLFFITFSEGRIHRFFLLTSYFLVGLSFLFRYFRAYSNIRHQVRLGTFHFVIYILAVELLPLLLIYKFASQILRIYL